MLKIHEPIISKDDPRYVAGYQAMIEAAQNRPNGGYQVIYADPAWYFETRSLKGQSKGALRHYPCMKSDLIASLPVAALAAKDCMLYMWCTWPCIFQADEVLQGWGFKYSGLGWEWIKKNPETKKYAFNGGYGTRKNLEPCIMATIGRPKVKTRSERDFLYAPQGKHSEKPIEALEKIERLSDGPYIELFARQRREGWDAWGDEV